MHIDIDAVKEAMKTELKVVQCVPTFIIFQDGKQIDTFEGANTQKLMSAVEKLSKIEITEDIKVEMNKTNRVCNIL